MPQLFFEGAAANAVLSETTMVPVLPSPRKRRTPRKRKSPRKRTPRKRRELAPLSGEVAEVLNWFEILVCFGALCYWGALRPQLGAMMCSLAALGAVFPMF